MTMTRRTFGGLSSLVGLFGMRPMLDPGPVIGRRYFASPPAEVGGIDNDATEAIQAILDGTDKKLRLEAGVWRVTAPLRVDAGTVIYLAAGCVLTKDFTNGGAYVGSLITNRVWGTSSILDPGVLPPVPVDDVRICGPGTMTAQPNCTGGMIGLYGDRIRLQNFVIDGWGGVDDNGNQGGRAISLVGNAIRVHCVQVLNPFPVTNAGGIRFYGGDDFFADRCHVESGDDALQFVPGGNPNDPAFGMDITNSSYLNCHGRSFQARFMVAGLQYGGPGGAPDDTVVMSSSIRNSGWIGCDGTGAQHAVKIQNVSSSGEIADIYVTDCHWEQVYSEGHLGEVSINGFTNTGGVHRVAFTDCSVAHPNTSSVAVQNNATEVTFTDCVFVQQELTDPRQPTYANGGRPTTVLVGGVPTVYHFWPNRPIMNLA